MLLTEFASLIVKLFENYVKLILGEGWKWGEKKGKNAASIDKRRLTSSVAILECALLVTRF